MEIPAITKPTRDLTADIAKGLGIIFVLIGHTPTSMTTWIYAFHMPLFVFISGYFYKQRPIKEELFKGYKGLIVPWLIFSVSNFIVVLSQVILTTHSIDGIINYILPINYRSYVLFRTIWFLPCLFIVRCLYNLLFKYYGSNSFWIAFLCYAIAYLLGSNHIKLPFFIDCALGLVIFYALGNVFAQSDRIKNFFNKDSTVSPIAITVISGGVFTLIVSILHPFTDWKINSFEWYNLFLTLIGIVFIWGVSNLMNRYLPQKFVKNLAFLGASSLVIMGLHHPVYDFYGVPILTHLGIPKQMWFVLMLLIIMPLTLLIGNKIIRINKLTKHRKRDTLNTDALA